MQRGKPHLRFVPTHFRVQTSCGFADDWMHGGVDEMKSEELRHEIISPARVHNEKIRHYKMLSAALLSWLFGQRTSRSSQTEDASSAVGKPQ